MSRRQRPIVKLPDDLAAPANARTADPAAGRAAVLAPLGIEAAVLRRATRPEVIHTGMGRSRSLRSVEGLIGGAHAGIVVAGVCGSLTASVAVGDVVVATEVLIAGDTTAIAGNGQGVANGVRCASAPLLAADIARTGITVHAGPLVSTPRLTPPAERHRLASGGAIAVDMESAWLAAAANGRPFAVVRAVTDGPGRDLSALRPLRTAAAGIAGLRALSRVGRSIDRWAAALAPSGRRVLLAGPRSFCAGVDRAVEIVERALERHGPPVYVRKQIVHNVHVVRDLERRGAVFVDEVEQVPEGAMVIFSAHGVSPDVRARARARSLRVIDATCPLVTKVHAEARRFARSGYTVFLVGHDGHEEVEGTTGEAPAAIRLVEPEQVNGDGPTPGFDGVADPSKVAYLTQTTLAAEDVRAVVDRLRDRFPAMIGPGSDDICYATQNRQDAVKAIARECDVLLAIGSENSSNSKRLVEVAEREGCAAHLIDDERDIELSWLAGATTIGLTAGASAPEGFVHRVIDALEGLGPVEIHERSIGEEAVRFTLPAELRAASVPTSME